MTARISRNCEPNWKPPCRLTRLNEQSEPAGIQEREALRLLVKAKALRATADHGDEANLVASDRHRVAITAQAAVIHGPPFLGSDPSLRRRTNG
jgi:hypothetical protein